MLNWKGFFDQPVDIREVSKSMLVLLFHIVLFVSLAIWVFRRKDVLS
jgi:ABC-type transport system involved in multi-copper enzyme maturation permease subunit